MSMWTPMEPNLGTPDEGIPAADPGRGAPPPADGFGVGGEEPGHSEEQVADLSGDGELPEDGDGGEPREDPAFRTPDPGEVGRG